MDFEYMKRALALAERGAGQVSPNPMVGCVIVKEGRVIGEGWHARCGGPHAERMALQSCSEAPEGATLYVTLEPCCHWGRTPPCTEAIVEAKIARVVVGCLDANPLVAGRGAALLQRAGITVDTGVMEADCRALNRVFFHFIQHKTPYVVLKYAMTLDGKLAAYTGDSRWVTGEAARRHVHQTRRRLSAIMVGVGTVLADDPLLTCRLEGGRDPVRIVCDSLLRTPLQAQVIRTARKTRTILATLSQNSARRADFMDAGVELIDCMADTEGRVDLRDLMGKLGALGLDSVLVEGGSQLQFAAVKAGVVHRVQAYIAPKLIGGARALSPLGGEGFAKMEQAVRLQNLTVTSFGEDILLEGEIPCSQES